jgi:hypothetical protein
MQIQVIRPFYLAGNAKLIGDVLDVPEALAAELIHTRKALGVPAEIEPAEPGLVVYGADRFALGVLVDPEPAEKPRRARKDKD